MKLFLVQHQAKAEDEDPERPLTPDGAADVARGAHRAVEQLGVRTHRVLHSGKTRARQTAEIWCGLLNVDGQQAEALAPNDDPMIWVGRLAEENDDLMLVGYIPHFTRLAAFLLTGAANYSVIQFQQGGLVGLERTDTGWAVELVLPQQAA